MGVLNTMNLHYRSAQTHLEAALTVFNKLNNQKSIKDSAKWLAKVLIHLNEMEKLEKIISKYSIDPAEIQLRS